MRFSSIALFAVLCAPAVGCDSDVEVQGGSSAEDGGGPTGGPSGIEGTWVGYVESFAFEDGSDVVTVSIDSAGPGGVTGKVVFGSRPLYDPPSDPDVAFPPGYQSGYPLTGFVFTIDDGSFDGQRLQLAVTSIELWSEWCALQTPIADDENEGLYWCVPNWGYTSDPASGCTQPNPDTGEDVPVDCGKLELCQGNQICRCEASGCAIFAAVSGDIAFDLKIVGDEADGSATGLKQNVHLKKQ